MRVCSVISINSRIQVQANTCFYLLAHFASFSPLLSPPPHPQPPPILPPPSHLFFCTHTPPHSLLHLFTFSPPLFVSLLFFPLDPFSSWSFSPPTPLLSVPPFLFSSSSFFPVPHSLLHSDMWPTFTQVCSLLCRWLRGPWRESSWASFISSPESAALLAPPSLPAWAPPTSGSTLATMATSTVACPAQ